jgi:hypothetical protein
MQKDFLSTELQIRQFRVLLQDSDSDVRRTETILAQPLSEQIEWCRWCGGPGQGLPINVDGMQGSLGGHCEWLVFPREG